MTHIEELQQEWLAIQYALDQGVFEDRSLVEKARQRQLAIEREMDGKDDPGSSHNGLRGKQF